MPDMNIIPRVLLPATVFVLCAAAPLHEFLSVAISPDGTHVASVEGDQDASGIADTPTVVIRGADSGAAAATVSLPCGKVHDCTPSSLAWRPDGTELDFVLRSPGSHARAIYGVHPDGTNLRKIMDFNGTLDGLRFSADGRLAMLAIDGATKEVGAVEAGAAQTGELNTDVHEQRLAVLQPDNTLRYASPPDLFVYEYDWRPDGSGFVGTAAHGDGDNNWWVAELYSFDAASGAARVIYKPAGAQQQLAQPRVAPDGRTVSFIAGLMSDFGATGGDAIVMPLDHPDAGVLNLSAGWQASVMALSWDCDGSLMARLLAGDQTRLVRIGTGAASATPPAPLYESAERMGGDEDGLTRSCKSKRAAMVHQSFTAAPEIEVGAPGQWHDLTQANTAQHLDATARSLSWQSGGHAVQGWLLLPNHTVAAGKFGMITEVHGGPAWANQPAFVGEGTQRQLLAAGYALLLPNPRGSYGQGEAFTRANVKDFGYGDLRDILAGVDAAERAAPIDDRRLGLTGWSYGGYMTMFAVTQTNRFHAAVAGAGLSDWLSYYGENGIDAWMIPYFGASVYDDPAVYAKSAPMSFIRQVRTPTLSVVGENDIECPAPQTIEFYHALHDLGIPSAAVVYPGEGHRFHSPAHIADITKRTVAWFNKYLTIRP